MASIDSMHAFCSTSGSTLLEDPADVRRKAKKRTKERARRRSFISKRRRNMKTKKRRKTPKFVSHSPNAPTIRLRL